jgi:hypothetical protein
MDQSATTRHANATCHSDSGSCHMWVLYSVKFIQMHLQTESSGTHHRSRRGNRGVYKTVQVREPLKFNCGNCVNRHSTKTSRFVKWRNQLTIDRSTPVMATIVKKDTNVWLIFCELWILDTTISCLSVAEILTTRILFVCRLACVINSYSPMHYILCYGTCRFITVFTIRPCTL